MFFSFLHTCMIDRQEAELVVVVAGGWDLMTMAEMISCWSKKVGKEEEDVGVVEAGFFVFEGGRRWFLLGGGGGGGSEGSGRESLEVVGMFFRKADGWS